MEYGYQDFDPGLNIQYLLNGMKCDKLSKVVATVRAHPDKYKKDFDTLVAFLSQYIDKRALTVKLKVASVGQSRPAKQQKASTTHGTFKGNIEWKKCSREECDSMSMAQHQ